MTKEECKESSDDPEDIDEMFDNPETAFRSKTFSELIRGYIVFLTCSSTFLVSNTSKLLKIGEKVLGDKMFSKIMKMTVFGHFVGGENKAELDPRVETLRKYGVRSILDYAAEEDLSKEEAVEKEMKATAISAEVTKLDEYGRETQKKFRQSEKFADRREKVSGARVFFYENEEACDRNTEHIVESIHAVADQDESIAAVKLTALARPELLLLLSEAIVRARQFVKKITGQGGTVISHHLTVEELSKKLHKAGIKDVEEFISHVEEDENGLLHIFPWQGILNEEGDLDEMFKIPSLSQQTMVPLFTKLPDDEKQMFRNAIKRMKIIAGVADECNVGIMIDAEQTYFQPAISRLTMEFMYQYNKEKAVIYNTYQSYLKSTFTEVVSDLEQAERQNFFFGIKLVRGAYLIQERERAKEMGYEDPTNETYDDTTDMYHSVIKCAFSKIRELKEQNSERKIFVCIASHNEETVKYTMDQMKKYKITKEDNVVSFAQLLGMCDYISFPLGQAGYRVYKYVPYGPIQKVIPYLVRRVQENIGVLQKLKKEKHILLREMMRRILRGKIFYKP